MSRPTSCEARQHGDEMQCGRCGLTWATNDPERPACAPRIDKRAIPTRATTRAVQRLGGAVESPPVDEGLTNICKFGAANPYGCHSRLRPIAGSITHAAQDGYDESTHVAPGALAYFKVPRWVPVRHVMSTECGYDKSATDARCAGCPHVKGE